MQLQNTLENQCYFNLPRLKSLDLMNPISQRVLHQVHEQELPTTTKRKKGLRLKHVLQHENNKTTHKCFDFPTALQQSSEEEVHNKFPKLKIRLIPAREENNSKLSLEKFTFKDPNTPRPLQFAVKKRETENQQIKSSSMNSKVTQKKKHIQMEQLKTVQQTIMYYLSQQTNKLDHHFDILENQLLSNLRTGTQEDITSNENISLGKIIQERQRLSDPDLLGKHAKIFKKQNSIIALKE